VSIVVFHPSTAPHVQQAARAIFETGQLERFITAVRDDPDWWLERGIIAAGRLVRRDLAREFARRAVVELPREKVESHPWGELLRIAVSRLDRDGRLTDLVWDRTEPAFDRMVARRIHARLTGVYGFDYSSLATFRRARALGLRVIYDVPALETNFVHAIFAAEIARLPLLRTPYFDYTAPFKDRRAARRREEWQLADLIVVNSQVTRSSYVAAGLDCTKVRVATLGAPVPLARDLAVVGPPATEPLTLLWAGNFTALKGAHYLLEAWRSAHFGRQARLRVFGAVALPDPLLHPLPEGIILHGSVPRAELFAHYRQADALIFPTLCDGFGMVATEAWSQGLPVIMTDRAGAMDLLQPQRNGLLVRAGDSTALVEVIQWCLDHRAELRAMRESAQATAASWQWADYRRTHAGFLREAGLFASS
jgi:glycosyltransferase involved in cell wall biosynthesis